MAHTPKFDSHEQEAFLNLWRTYDRLRAIEDDFFASHALTGQQYNVLRILRAVHPQTLTTLAIADRLISRAPDITRMLDKLERRSLVHRARPAENRRTVRVGITKEGRQLLDDLRQPLANCHQQQLGHLSPHELQQLIDLLQLARHPHEPPGSVWCSEEELIQQE